MSQQPLAIVGSGMVTGVGLSASTTCAAIRCGINNFQETRFMDSAGEWIVASEVPLDQPWHGPEKLARMLVSVIKESFEGNPYLVPEETPLIFCLSERNRPGRPNDLNEQISETTRQLLGFDLSAKSITVSQGRVGAAIALREARLLLYQERAPAVLVAGTDSYLSAQSLFWFEGNRRLLTTRNSDGFIPGEGAAAIIATRPQASEDPQLVMIGLGFGVEEANVESEQPLRADGLFQAVSASLAEAGISMGNVDFRIADVSGEQYGFKEASIALARTLRERKEEFEIWHAADCIGETGAACGLCALNVASAASEHDYARGKTVLCTFGNDDGKRAAVVLTYQPVRAHG